MRKAKFQRLPNEIPNINVDYSVHDPNNPNSQKLYPFYERNISQRSFDWDEEHDVTYDPSIYCATNNILINGFIINCQSYNNVNYETSQTAGTSEKNKTEFKVDKINEEKKQLQETSSSVFTASEDEGNWIVVTSKKQKRKKYDVTYDPPTYNATNITPFIGTTVNKAQSLNNGIHESVQSHEKNVNADEGIEEKSQIHETSSSASVSSIEEGKWIIVKSKRHRRRREN